MPHAFHIALATTALAAALATPANAQEVLGTVTGTVGGEEREWYVTASDEGSQSDWLGSETWAEVSVVAHSTPDTIMRTTEALMVGFTLTGAGDNANASGAEVTFLVEGFSAAYVGEDDAVTVTITEHSVTDGVLSLAGTVEGTLAWTEDFGRTVDPDDTVVLEASFDTSVRPLQ